MTIPSPPYGVRQFNYQVVLIDMQGSIYESCDSIFPTEIYQGKSLKDLCYFFEGELDNIINSKATKITFEKIRIDSRCFPGYYDFVFSKQEIDGQQFIRWELFDYTAIYEEYTFLQQLQNEIAIHLQLLKKEQGSAKNNLEFFQSGYTSGAESNISNIIVRSIESKFMGLPKLFNNDEKIESTADLERLKKFVCDLNNEIVDFIRLLKNGQVDQIDIRNLVSTDLDSSSFDFTADLPKTVAADKYLVKKILKLLAPEHNQLPFPALKNVEISTHQNLSNDMFVRIAVEEETKFLLNSVCTLIRLSALKTLITMVGGDLTLIQKENYTAFFTKVDIPIK